MSNYYFKKRREFRSRKKGDGKSSVISNIKSKVLEAASPADSENDAQDEEEAYASPIQPRYTTGRRSRKKTIVAPVLGRRFGNVFTGILVILILLFLIFLLLMQRPHVAMRRFIKSMLKEQMSVLNYIGKEGDFSKSFLLKASSDHADLEYLLGNTSLSLELDTLSKVKVANFSMNYLGQDIVELTGTYQKGKIGLQSSTASETDYFTTDIDRFITALTGEDLEIKTYLEAKITPAQKNKLIRKYANAILSVINEKNISVSKNKTIVLDSLNTDFKGRLYTFRPKAKDMEKMLLELGREIRRDELLRKVLKSSGMELELLTSKQYGNPWYSNLLSSNDTDVMLSDLANFLVDNAKTIANELETGGFRCEIGVKSGKIRYINLTFDDKFGSTKSMVMEKDVRGTQTSQVYTYSDEASSSIVSLSNSYTTEKNFLRGQASVLQNGMEDMNVSYDFDKKKKTIFLPIGEYEWNSLKDGLSAELRISDVSNKQTEYKMAIQAGEGSSVGVGAWNLNLMEEDIPKLSPPSQKARDMDLMAGSEYREILDSLERGMTSRLLALLGYQVEN